MKRQPNDAFSKHDGGIPMNLERIASELDQAIRRAAARIGPHLSLTRKGANPQTNLDTAVDDYLHKVLVQIVEAPILSEESHGRDHALIEAPFCWVIDPIDGTMNAIAGVEDYAISVALISTRPMEPVVGAVYIPRRDLMFIAASGLGSKRNGALIETTRQESRARPLLDIASFGVPKDIPAVAERMSTALHRLMSDGWVTRQTGAASIDICRVASGAWSAFFEYRLMYWDYIAASLIAKEAGCRMLTVPSGALQSGEVALEYDIIIARSQVDLGRIASATGIGR
ncbi:inositol monophosphatase [Micromonospora chokoriensis]